MVARRRWAAHEEKKMSHWIICPVCSGEGKCVNPNIDAHGLTAEDFHEDPDFAEEYFGGTFDEPCRPCRGTGKMKSDDLEKLEQAAEDRKLAAREDGDYDAYCVAGDYRYGY